MTSSPGVPPLTGREATRLKTAASAAAITVAAMLLAAKVAGVLLTGSISLLSTLVDSALDLSASLLNLWAIRHAARPADDEHRFGHGKAEPLAGLGQAAFIGGSAAFLMIQSLTRLANPRPLAREEWGVGVMVLGIVLTGALVLFQRSVVRRTGSVAIQADSLHYVSDFLVAVGVIAALVSSRVFGWLWVDPVFGLGMGVYIVLSAWKILQKSLRFLMDEEMPEPDRLRILGIARSQPGVRDAHDLRTRSSGTQLFIQIHVELDGDLPLRKAHTLADGVMHAIQRVYPGSEVLVHQDPHGLPEDRPSFA